jgi:hypothetical protein
MVHSSRSSLIQLGKVFGTMLLCVVQVLLLFQFMPYGGLYIGLLSLILDLAFYCWLVSGAYKALGGPPKPKKISGGNANTIALALPLDKHR